MSHPEWIGRYRVLDILGKGAMGIVYRGRDETLDRDVALKVMSMGQGDREARERFAREAKVAARLQHPNIITIYEFGEHEGSPFMALELLEGVDLQRAIEAGIRPNPKITLPIVLQLVSGLGHAHEHGIVHRDVKPSNIFLPRGRPAKIMDFGVARLAGGATSAGMVVGTANYMSPEQVRAGPLDGRSDLFSAGLILYELVTGEKAYRGDTVVGLLYKIAHQDPELGLLPRDGPFEKLRSVVTRALARDPNNRYGDAHAMVADLELALRDLGGHPNWAMASDAGLLVRTGPRSIAAAAEKPTPEEPAATAAKPPLPMKSILIGAAGLAGASLGILAFALFLASRPPSTPSPEPTITAAPPSPTVPSPPSSSQPATVIPTAAPTSPPPPSSAPVETALPSASPHPSATATSATPRPSAAPTETPYPEPADARVDRAEEMLEQRRYAAALAEAKAVLRREPNNLRAKTVAEDAELELVVESRIKTAREALRRGDPEAALDAIKAGLTIKPTDSRLLELWREATKD